ncbi:MAG: ABC transporter substrate-binding protein [Polyangiaceae bacterium]|nr:ABC transporter substrate-binding protein [Polyangiaceae bacterium]
MLQEDEEQCSNTGDCEGLGPAFLGTTCSSEGRCVPGAPNNSGSGGVGGMGGMGGMSGGGGLAGVAGALAACQKNSDCFGAFGRSICRQQSCVSLVSPENGCIEATGKINDDDATNTIIGFLTSRATTSTQALLGDSMSKAFDLARSGYETSNAQVAPLAPVVVVCDEVINPARSARYLIDTLGAKVIVGPTFDQNVAAVLAETRTTGVPLVSPTADGVALTQAPLYTADNLLWSCRPNRAKVAGYYQSALDQAIASFTAKGGDFSTARAVLIAPADGMFGEPSAAGFVAELERAVKLNGVLLPNNGANYQRINYAWSLLATTDFASIGLQVQTLAGGATPPNLILLPSSIDQTSNIIDAIESRWPAAPDGAPKPFYLIDEPPELLPSLIGAHADVRSRILGLRPYRDAQSRSAFNEFVNAFRAQHGSVPVNKAEYAFDCFYETWYALLAASPVENGRVQLREVNAGAMRRGVDLLTGGEPVFVGKAGTSPFITKLLAKKGADLIGSSGPLTYTTGSNQPDSNAELYCISNFNSPCRTGIVIASGTGTVTNETVDDCTCGN